jgi:hypothetical protein
MRAVLGLILLVIGALLASRLIMALAELICRIDFRPPEFIAQVIVERVTSNWLTSGGAPEARPELGALLDKAQRLTRNADFRARIAAARCTITQAGPPSDAQYTAVGGALMGLLRWHATLAPRPRPVPANWWQFVCYRTNIVDLFLAACAGTLVWQASYLLLPSAGPAIWEPLTRFLAIFLLVHGLLGALTIVLSSILLYQSHARFRSLLVTPRPISDPLVRRAIASMAPHGKLIAFLLDQPQPTVWPDLDLNSLASDIMFAEAAYIPTIVGSLVSHSDFLVLDIDVSMAVEMLPMLKALPKSRRGLLLGPDDAAPDAYTALNKADFADGAMLRRFTWADRDDAAPNYDHTAHSYGAEKLIYTFSGAALLAGIALLSLQHLRVLGIYVLACGLLGIYPRILGPRRRDRPLPPRLGKPKSPRISHLLTYYRSWTQWFYAAGSLAGLGLTYSIYGHSPEGAEILVACLVMFSAGSLALLHGIPGLLRALKWYLDWNFRIVILHRNLPDTARLHKEVIMPLCGAYGQVIMISDAELAALHISSGAKFAHEVLSEHYNTIRHDDHIEGWTDHIAREIARADFAVFDWRVEVSTAMIWELEQALAALPPARIMVLYDGKTEDSARQILAEMCGPTAGEVFFLRLPSLVPLAERMFREALRLQLSELEAESRPANRHRPEIAARAQSLAANINAKYPAP